MNELKNIQIELLKRPAGLRPVLGFVLLVFTLVFQNSILAETVVNNDVQIYSQNYHVAAHTDSLKHPNVAINVQKTVDREEVCLGDSVIYTLTVRILGGGDGIDIRNIRISDSEILNQLTIASPQFLKYSDINGNEILDFIDENNDGKSDEEFVWIYSKVISENNVNVARDTGDVFFNGNFIGQVSNRDQVTVTVNDSICNCENPIVMLTGGDITCNADQVQILLSTDGDSFSWTGPNGFTSNLMNPVVSVPGIYTVTVSTGDCHTTRSISIGADFSKPMVVLTGGNLTCGTDTIQILLSTDGDSFSWTGPNGFNSNLMNPSVSVPGEYTVTVSSGTCTTTQSITIEEDLTPPVVNLTGGNLTCSTDTIQIILSTDGDSFSWTGPNGFTSNLANPSVSVPGEYTVTVSSRTCTTTQSITIDEDLTPPVVNLTGDTLTCNTDTVQISLSTDGDTFSWTGPNGFTSNLMNPSVSVPGEYTVTVSSGTCTTTQSITIEEDITPPIVNLTGGNLTCNTDTIQIILSTDGDTFSWTGPNGFNSNLMNPSVSVPGEYTVTVSSGSCTTTQSITIEEDLTPPVVNLTGGSLTCGTDTIQIILSTDGDSFSWTGPNGFNSNLMNPSVSMPGEYIMTVSSGSCTTTQSITIEEDITPPVVNLTSGNLTCNTDTIQIILSTDGDTFSWTGPNAFTSKLANPSVSVPGEYTVTVSSGTCTTTQTITIEENLTPPVVNLTGGSLTCSTDSIQIILSTDGDSSSWIGPNGFNSTIMNPSVSVPGEYTVTVSSGSCTTTQSITIEEDLTPPVVNLTGGNLTCNTDTIQIILSTDGDSFSWTGPNGFTSNLMNPSVSVPGEYTVMVSSGTCTTTQSITIEEDLTPPVVNLTGGSLTCSTDSIQIILSTDGDTFSWTGPNGFNSTIMNPSVSVPGEYTVTVSSGTCTTTQSITIEEDLTPPVVNLTGGSLTCSTDSIQIILSTDGDTFSWTGPNGFNSTIMNPSVSVPGEYTVKVSSGMCTTTRSITIEEDLTPPVVNLSGGILSCSNPSVSLNPTSNGSIISLTGPDPKTDINNPVATIPGIYTLTALGNNGCPNSTTAIVRRDSIQLGISGQVDSTECNSKDGRITIQISGGQSPYVFIWSNGDSIQNLENLSAGRYTVSVSDVNGCTGMASFIVNSLGSSLGVNIEINQKPTCSLGAIGSITAVASNGTPTYSYKWDTGDTSRTISNLEPGTYYVDVIDEMGCFATDSISLIEEEDCNAIIGDLVFDDINQNGIQDLGEQGFPGLRVRLLDRSGILIDEVVTDSNGNYLFVGLRGGQYIIEVEWPFGYAITQPDQGLDDEADSDINTMSQRTGIFTLENHETNFSIDAGFFKTTSIGDYAWHDLNENGIQDTNELGIEGVKVILYNENDVLIDSTNTNANGIYNFIELLPGDYYVQFVLPELFRFSPSIQGNDVSLDSDADQSTGRTALFSILENENITIDAGLVRAPCDQLSMIPEDSLVTFCSMDVINLAVTTNFGDSVIWFDQDANEIGQGLTIEINPFQVNSAVAIGSDGFGCSDTSIFTIAPFSFDININAPEVICEDEEFSISVQSTSSDILTYEWAVPPSVSISDFLSPNPTFLGNFDDPLMLQLSVTKNDEPECFLDTTISIQVLQVDITTDEGEDDCILLGESITLTAQTNADNPVFNWEPVSSIEIQITDAPEVETIYEVQVTDTTLNKTCSALDTISVFPCIWDVPDAFSPNGNINNDEFRVRSAKNADLSPFNMKILNRWGEEVFISTSINEGWNGQFKNRNLPSDVYAYCIQVTCPDGTIDIRSGNVTLIR